MKKLFALVLCVMMLVSVVPTMAFAAPAEHEENYLETATEYANLIKDTLKQTRENIEDAYKAVVGDKVVYNTAVAMDDTLMAMFDKLWDAFTDADLDDTYGSDEDTQKAALRTLFGTLVADELPEDYADGDGLEKAQDFAAAVSKAFANKDFQKGYEAMATYIALENLVSDINDDLDDEFTEFLTNIDADFVNDDFAGYNLGDYVQAVTEKTDDATNPWALFVEAVVTEDDD